MPEAPRLPERIEQYRVLDRIGRGGMGEIYTAHDERLDRIVAIKTISPAWLPDARARRQMLAEARAAAALSHPFICTIHEVIDVGGVPVIVMEYVHGESLAQRVLAGPLPPHEICRIGIEIAEALSSAHARGIVHRDISAGNIMLTQAGHAKVMDFGLARLSQSAASTADEATMTSVPMTEPVGIQGTPAYVPPEVLTGAPADARSDLYSFGVVLYQMAAGRLPFIEETSAALAASILTRLPVSPRTLVPSLPWAVETVVLKLLEKAPEARFASARAVAAALADASSPAATRGGCRRALAVLPFRALGQSTDPELGVGIADATITELAAVRSLLVRPTAAILPYHHGTIDPIRAGRELSVDAVVDGTLQQSGGRIRATVQLLSTSDGRPLWGTKVDAPADDVFRLQDDVSREILRAIESQLLDDGEEVVRTEPEPRATTRAQEHYMRGRVHMLRDSLESFQAAASEFEAALRVDPGFARAAVGLGSAHARIGFIFKPDDEYYPRASALAERALAIDPDLPEAHYLKGLLAWSPPGNFQYEVAIRELCRTIRGLPGYNEAHDLLGVVLVHVSMFEEATRELERALAINPQDQFAYFHLGLSHYYAGDWARALELFTEAWRRAPSGWAGYQLGLVHVQLGSLDEAERLSEAMARRFPEDVLAYSLNAVIAALRGDAAATDRRIQQTIDHRKAFGHYHHAQYDIACAHALLGRGDQAVDWLRGASTNGFPCADFFRRDRLLVPLRGLPAFHAVIEEATERNARCRSVYRECRESTN